MSGQTFMFNGREQQIWTQTQLEQLGKAALKKRAMDIRDLAGDGLPPMPRHPDLLVPWVLESQRAMAGGGSAPPSNAGGRPASQQGGYGGPPPGQGGYEEPPESKPKKMTSPLLQALINEGYSVPQDCNIESFGRKLEHPRDWSRQDRQPQRRREVLMETLLKLGTASARASAHETAQNNLKNWRDSAKKIERKFPVIKGDWGETTLDLTRTYGTTFAVLNMANAYGAGGGYTEGMPAQEENMFRRTDCHFGVDEKEFNQDSDRYLPQFTDLINALNGEVPLDVKNPRVCIRGGEMKDETDLGYAWLHEDSYFEFHELRSAAVDLRGGLQFKIEECRKRIDAQLDTLTRNGIRYAVLSAFGCGAFLNPPETVSQCYCDALKAREKDFDCVAFAIFYPGYGYDNYTVFKQVFERNGMEVALSDGRPFTHQALQAQEVDRGCIEALRRTCTMM